MALVTDRGIIFSADSVRAIASGVKTQTRRLVTVPWKGSVCAPPYDPWWADEDGRLLAQDEAGDFVPAEQALGTWQVGQRVYVKETWCVAKDWYPAAAYAWKADYQHDYEWTEHTDHPPNAKSFDCMACGFKGWRSPMLMPRAAARHHLEVTEVRIERVTAIAESDALAEGCVPTSARSGRDVYHALWDDLHAKAHPWAVWEKRPWVWRIVFRRLSP